MLNVGVKAPDFKLPDQNGVEHTLSEYKGKKVILYFYPKDNTSGCTAEACNFRDRLPQIQEKGAIVKVIMIYHLHYYQMNLQKLFKHMMFG